MRDTKKITKVPVQGLASTAGYALLGSIFNIPFSLLPSRMKKLSKEFNHLERTEVLQRFIQMKDKKNTDVIRLSGVSKDYFYAIYSGKRTPSRDKTIQLCFGLELNKDEANLFLKKMGHNELYLRDERDVIIYVALNDRRTLEEVNDFLEKELYETFNF